MSRNYHPKGAVAKLLSKCLSCGHPGAHYVPPSLGDKGFFACDAFCDVCRPAAPAIEGTENP